MSNPQAKRLREVVETTARQGENDGRWFLAEHQLYEARFALQTARFQMEQVCDNPENAEEYELASIILEALTPTYVRLLGDLAAIKALLAGTEVAGRIGGQDEA